MRRFPRFAAPVVALCLATAAAVALAAPAAPAANRVDEYARLLRAAMAQASPAVRGPVAELIARARTEQDPLLHRMMVSNLVRQKMPLLREQKREVLGLVRDPARGLLPKAPPIPRQGTIEVRHYSMSGFLEPDLEHVRAAGFQVRTTPGGAEATKGRIHVVFRQTHQNILQDLADPAVHMVVYNGHSQLGGVVEQALEQPGLRGPSQRKLVALFQCSGTQTLPFLKTAMPNVDVITSNQPLFVNETPDLVAALYTSVENGDTYHQMRRRMQDCTDRRGNVVYPNQSANLRHVDFDPNGVLDIHDQAGVFQMLQGPARAAAAGLMSGVHFLTSMNPYYVEESKSAVLRSEHVRIPLVAKGLAGVAGGSSVTQVASRAFAGQRRFEVTLNPGFADASRAFVGAAAVFDVQMQLQREFLHRGLTERLGNLFHRNNGNAMRDKLRALAFAANYLDVIPRDRGEAQAAFDRLTQVQGLPRLSLWAVQGALRTHVVEEEAITRLEQLVRDAQQLPPR